MSDQEHTFRRPGAVGYNASVLKFIYDLHTHGGGEGGHGQVEME